MSKQKSSSIFSRCLHKSNKWFQIIAASCLLYWFCTIFVYLPFWQLFEKNGKDILYEKGTQLSLIIKQVYNDSNGEMIPTPTAINIQAIEYNFSELKLNEQECDYEPYYNYINKMVNFTDYKNKLSSFSEIKMDSHYCNNASLNRSVINKLRDYLLESVTMIDMYNYVLISICNCTVVSNYPLNVTINKSFWKYRFENIFKQICQTYNDDYYEKNKMHILPNTIFMVFMGDGDPIGAEYPIMNKHHLYQWPYIQTEGSIPIVASNTKYYQAFLMGPRSYYIEYNSQFVFNRLSNTKKYKLNDNYNNNNNNNSYDPFAALNQRIVFRGGCTGNTKMKRWNEKSGRFESYGSSMRHQFILFNYTNIAKEVVDIKFVKTREGDIPFGCQHLKLTESMFGDILTYEDQSNNMFLLSIDGNSVADRLAYQMMLGSVMIKHESNKIEFWYYHLKNFTNYIAVKTPKHLNAIVNEWYKNISNVSDTNNIYLKSKIEKARNIATNGVELVENHYNQHSMDCFTANMIRYFSYQTF